MPMEYRVVPLPFPTPHNSSRLRQKYFGIKQEIIKHVIMNIDSSVHLYPSYILKVKPARFNLRQVQASLYFYIQFGP